MQSSTIVTHRLFSILIFLIFVSTTLTAQNKVVIKERLEINPKSNHTLQADMSSSNFPYFVGTINHGIGDVDPKDYRQSFSVFRPCNIICTGTFESAEEIPVNILVGLGASNEIAIANRTDSLQVNCGEVYCCLYNWLPCGCFFNVNVSGSISDKLITYTMNGEWCCIEPHHVPFTATMTLQAIPISNKEPCNIVMNATRTSFDERMEGPYDLMTNLFPAVCDDSGTQIPYCGPAPMVVTIENPFSGTYFIDDPSNIINLGTSRTIENTGCVRFYWDGSDLPDGKDSLDISIKAECLGMVGTQTIQLKKYIYPCLVVKMSKKEMSPGDTAAISLIALKNGTEQSYPADQDFCVWTNIDEQYGKLHCSSPVDSGSYVYGQQPFIFIAADSIDIPEGTGDSIVVEIGAREGGGGVGSIGIVTKDTLRLTEPIMASKQGTAKNIGNVSNEMKRKNIELSMNSMQARLNKVSARKGDEKQQQKLAIGIEQLKARLAYETAKTPAEKRNALASMKQSAMLAAETEECKSTASVTIEKPVLKILDHSPWTIWPYLPPQNDGASRGAELPGYNSKRTFTIQVLKGDKIPFPNKQVKITTSFTSQSGGHQHMNGTIEMPQGIIQGWFHGQGQQKVNPITITTDAQGFAVVDSFIASQISGQYLITASLVSDASIKDTVNIQIKVPGLVNFRNNVIVDPKPYIFWQTDNGKANHPDNVNTWCNSEMGNNLYLAILDFYLWTMSGGGTAIQTSINDMSLPWGGLFDIGANWNIDNPSHSFHRIGLSVDINRGDMNGDQLDQLTYYIITFHHGIRNHERPMIHYGFNGGN